jgi:cation diffusion facilitator family transporter
MSGRQPLPIILKKVSIIRWPIYSNTLLLIMKVLVAAATGSASVLAEVMNSATDLVGNIISYLSVTRADLPPDKDHPYGHGKIENLSGLAISLILLVGGIFAIQREVEYLVHGTPIVRIDWALLVMGLSALVNVGVSTYLIQAGLQTDSPAITAEGRHLQTDIYTSLGAFIGLGLVRFSGIKVFDPLVGLIVSLITIRMGYILLVDAIGVLSDSSLPAKEEALIKKTIKQHPKVMSFHKLRTRKSGSHRYADVHIQIADSHTFVEAHRVTEELEEELRSILPNLHPIIHTEPYEEEATTYHNGKSHPSA